MMAVASALLLVAAWLRWMPLGMTEVLGFVTGGVGVWLVVRENVWNWPIGLANNVFFFILFLQERLFADMGLQVVYLVLGVYGWWHWLYGGEQRTELRISRATRVEWIGLAVAVPLATWGLREVLIAVQGAAPFWDSLTTVLSLAAQYLLTWKRIENWWLWIAADLIYVPLYVSRGLPLTAVLFAIFFVMCVTGLRAWRRSTAG